MRPHTLRRALEKALATCKLPSISWYQATRHTFASLWVIEGHSLEKLSKILGHASVTTTERYAHLSPDHFKEGDFDAVRVDFSQPQAEVVSTCPPTPEGGTLGCAAVTVV
jgi:integrase